MPTYRAPVDDYQFLLTELIDTKVLSTFPGYEDVSPELLVSVVEEAGKFVEGVLFPLNMSGDAEGCRWENGTVTTPAGFRDAFRQYADGGWIGVALPTTYGGQGLPLLLRSAVEEMVCGANLSFAMYPGLTQGASEALHAHASTELQQAYLPKLIAGQWTGTMCLTEAHAGTDLGMIRTRAEPMDDGSFSVTGTKIFITAGEHDLAENIVHLVLAKLPDAPAGSKGISMLLVPKILPNADGSLGARNGVTCGSIEHKMGIKGSATCVLNFENAKGWLVGQPHKGLQAMFTMMNGARLSVGLQGLGLATASYHSAVAYARERLQGRSLSGVKNPSGPADPIIEHADVRRGLLFMRAFTEGARALAMYTASHLDHEHFHPDAKAREQAADTVALLTPIVKAFFTDFAFESANVGMQMLGGHGYIREYGMEQYVRDARIGQIYEGTNYVQSLDLVGRKVLGSGGSLYKQYVDVLRLEIASCASKPALAEHARALQEAVGLLDDSTSTILEASQRSADEIGVNAQEYLRLFGYVALGHMWLRTLRVIDAHGGSTGSMPASFYEAKRATGAFYFARMLPMTRGHAAAIAHGGATVLGFPQAAF